MEGSQVKTPAVPWDDADDLPAMIEPTPELVEGAYNAVINKELPPEVGDPAITARLILERIRRGSFDESMSPLEGLPNWADNYEGVPVTVFAFHLNPSAFEDEEGRKGAYAAVEVGDPDGNIVTVSTGSGNVLVQLIKAWEEKRFPFQAVLEGQKTATPGRKTYWLRKEKSES